MEGVIIFPTEIKIEFTCKTNVISNYQQSHKSASRVLIVAENKSLLSLANDKCNKYY